MSEKKRSNYKAGSKLDLPAGVDKTKYGYRWLNAERLAAASDGYEHRGYELHLNADGKPVRRDDLVLGRMPIDQYEAMKEQKENDRKDQIGLLLEEQVASNEKQLHEFKRKGGKVKFEFKQE